jgi:hypothetical protein
MLQTVVAYLIVAVAAGWTAWSLGLRGWWTRRRAAGTHPARPASGCGPDCSCGD